MMRHANLPVKMCYKLCKEAFNTATKLDNLITVQVDGKVKTRYEHFGELARMLRTWGKAGVVMTGKDGKTGDQGCTCIFVGYADNHDADCYRMYNPETQVSETRDVTWLKRMYYTTARADLNNVEPGIILELESSDENENVNENTTDNNDDESSTVEAKEGKDELPEAHNQLRLPSG